MGFGRGSAFPGICFTPGGRGFDGPLGGPVVPFGLQAKQVASDFFSYPNGPLSGNPNWAATIDGSLTVTSHVLLSTAAQNGNYRTDAGYSSDQFSQCSVAASVTTAVGPTVRNTATGNCYWLLYSPTNSGFVALFKRVGGGALIELASLPTGILALNTTLRIVAEQSQITGYVNGVAKVSWADPGGLTGGAPGVMANTAQTGGWSGGNVATGPALHASATDTFNRANGNMSAGQPGWQTLAGVTFTGLTSVDPIIVSNQLNTTGTTAHNAAIRTETYKGSQYASIAQGSVPLTYNGAGFIGMLTEINTSNGGALNSGHLFVMFANNEAPLGNAKLSRSLYRLDAGVSTWIGGVTLDGGLAVNPDPVGTQYFGVSQDGVHTFAVQGPGDAHPCAIFSVADATYQALGVPGVMLFPATVQPPAVTAENFAAGSLVG